MSTFTITDEYLCKSSGFPENGGVVGLQDEWRQSRRRSDARFIYPG